MSKLAIRIGLVAILLVLGAAVMAGDGDKLSTTQPGARQPVAPERFTLSSTDTEESLQKFVGKEVIVSGIWDGPGKTGEFIRAAGKGGKQIYVTASTEKAIHKLNWVRADFGANVELRGVLHFSKYQPPPSDLIQADLVQVSPTHFYFDIEDVSFRFPKK
jgi:hypothetical protein